MASQSQSTINAEDPFGRRLRYERERRGWTQADVAKRLAERGITLHPTAIAKIEQRDSRRPRVIRLDEAAAIADIFGLSVNDMLKPEPTIFRDASSLAEQWARATEHAESLAQRFFDVLHQIGPAGLIGTPTTEVARAKIAIVEALARVRKSHESLIARHEAGAALLQQLTPPQAPGYVRPSLAEELYYSELRDISRELFGHRREYPANSDERERVIAEAEKRGIKPP